MTLNPNDRTTLEANKREMSDGMRAYHQSEISHSNHAITMLLGVAAAAGAIVLAILFPQRTPDHIVGIAWGLFVSVAILSLTIAITTHLKISADHASYEKYGKEYVRTSTALGLYDDVDANGVKITVKENKHIGEGTGYRKTQTIIWAFTCEITLLTLVFAGFFGVPSCDGRLVSQLGKETCGESRNWCCCARRVPVRSR